MGILDAPALRPYRDSIFNGLPVVASRPNTFTIGTGNLSNGTDTSANFRFMHTILVTADDLRFVFANHYAANTPGLNQVTVKASVEYPAVAVIGNGGQNGGSHPIRFQGRRSVDIDPGCFVVSDPVPFSVVAGEIIYTRTYVSVGVVGFKWPIDLYTKSANWEGATRGAPAADLSAAGGTTIAQSNEPGYGPVAVLGVPRSGRPKVVAIVGDSIGYGSGDTDPNGLGFIQRALAAASIGYVNVAKPGEQGTSVTGAADGGFLMRNIMIGGATHVIEQYGVNDVYSGARTLAQIQADKLTIWTRRAVRGQRVWTTTITPQTTSSDSWATTANQTAPAANSVRVDVNNWIRAGAPIDPTTKAAVAIGTVGALLFGQAGHPAVGYFEVADAAESARDSGKWKVTGAANYATADGTHPSAAMHTLMAAAIVTGGL